MDNSFKKYFIIMLIFLALILVLFIPLIIILNKKSSNPSSSNEDNDDVIINPKNKVFREIRIVQLPYKRIYKEGEYFDKSGMIVNAYYDTDYNGEYIDNYIILNNGSLTIYDTKILVYYKKCLVEVNIKVINEEGFEIYPNPSKEKYTLEPIEGITRFEIEDSDISKWIISTEENTDKIIKRDDASRGTFLSGMDADLPYDGELKFNLDLQYNAEIIMSVSYSQKEKYKHINVDLTDVYLFFVDENKEILIDEYPTIKVREDITKWQLIKYKKFYLTKGLHTISLISHSINFLATPNIDYINFQTKKIDTIPIDPDSEEIPSNDFHTLVQYRYITDEIPENIFNYAYGQEDLSRPRGNLLDFSDSIEENSDYYVIQISSSEDFDSSSDTKIISDLTEKYYIIKNLKLGQKIFYRGAINEVDLANSKIYSLTVNTLPPRNLDIPGVDNCRDIGGVKTTLVENGKINQGLYYRTAAIDYVEEEGKRIIREDLGIKVEIDLRDEVFEEYGPYVEGLEYHYIPMSSATSNYRFEQYEEEYKKVYNLMANADNKPIALHCQAGADRTGIMTFSLLTLLGCEFNDIARDYLFTNFGVQGERNINSEFMGWWTKLDLYEGDTKAEKSKNWLMSKGIEEETLEHIREIFIDGYKKNIDLNNYKKENKNEYILNEYNKKFAEFISEDNYK